MMRNLPLIDEIEAALNSGTNSRRIEMLTRITDLFVGSASRYSDEQIGVFDDVMVRLVSTIETPARAKLAQQLAPIASAPSNVIHLLAFDDDIDVAQPVLKQSEQLADPALVASARTKSQRHLFAISQRRSLSEAVTDVLVERGDRGVVQSVVKNAGARFSDAGFRLLVNRSAADDDLATFVGRRSDIPRPHFLVLLEKASAAVRDRLAARDPTQQAPSRALWRRSPAAFVTMHGTHRRILPRRWRRWSGRTACAASARPKFMNTRTIANSRRRRSRCRFCATRPPT